VKQRRYELATNHFMAAIRINPDNSSALNNFGRCLAELGRAPEALAKFQEAVRLNTNYVEAYCNLGSSYLVLGKPDEATKQFETALTISNGFGPALMGLERVKRVKPR
jgi:tetratricopeptide (TPR) repeat protein